MHTIFHFLLVYTDWQLVTSQDTVHRKYTSDVHLFSNIMSSPSLTENHMNAPWVVPDLAFSEVSLKPHDFRKILTCPDLRLNIPNLTYDGKGENNLVQAPPYLRHCIFLLPKG